MELQAFNFFGKAITVVLNKLQCYKAQVVRIN